MSETKIVDHREVAVGLWCALCVAEKHIALLAKLSDREEGYGVTLAYVRQAILLGQQALQVADAPEEIAATVESYEEAITSAVNCMFERVIQDFQVHQVDRIREGVCRGEIYVGPATTTTIVPVLLPEPCCGHAVPARCRRCGAEGFTHNDRWGDDLRCFVCDEMLNETVKDQLASDLLERR